MRRFIWFLFLSSFFSVNAQTMLMLGQTASEEDFVEYTEYPIEDSVIVELEKGLYRFYLRSSTTCNFPFGAEEGAKVRFNKPITLQNCADQPFSLNVRVAGDIQFTFAEAEQSITLKLIPKQAVAKPFVRPLPDIQCASWQSGPVLVNVSSQFADGEQVRNFYTGETATVERGTVSLTPAQGSNGLLLIEAVDAPSSAFTWDNALVYFIMTDRFENGDPENDNSFGRRQDGKDEIGTFHGGDIKGIIDKLDYIESLGANAIWMTPLVEQVHGFVGGGKNGEFPFYSYHGYWALDYTKLDPNFGTDEDLRTLVKEAHRRNIRLIWDTVINHAGYATLEDLKQFNVDVIKAGSQNEGNAWQPASNENWHSYHDIIDYNSPNWATQWWSNDWIRASFPSYVEPGADDLTLALAGLPDYLTESTEKVGLPPILKNKPDTGAADRKQTVIDHLIDWQTYWVREFGIDAFRSDTAKHVELEHWLSLKQKASQAYKDWQAENGDQVLEGENDFWMVGEVFDHPLFKDYYYDYGFDSLINFEFQNKAHDLAMCMTDMEETFDQYAKAINEDTSFNGLTYISSHDTTLFFAKYQSLTLQKRIAAPFLLLPGGVQIYYGDETGRNLGPYGDDFHQGTRSDMNWKEIKAEREALLKHWQIIGQFRKKHSSIGAGKHLKISDSPYTFSRRNSEDKVIIVFAGNESN